MLLDRRMPTPKRPYYGGHRKRLIDIQMSLFTISLILGEMGLHSMQFYIAIGMYFQPINVIDNMIYYHNRKIKMFWHKVNLNHFSSHVVLTLLTGRRLSDDKYESELTPCSTSWRKNMESHDFLTQKVRKNFELFVWSTNLVESTR